MTDRTAIVLFSGAANGWELGLHRAGVRTIAACEADPWRRQVTTQRWKVPVYDDVRTLTAARLASDGVDRPWLLCGSPPCQDASEANHKGRGVEGERTGLVVDLLRLGGELRPPWLALENVPRLRDRGADRILATLAEIGYAAWPLVVGLGATGAAHRRERVWIVASDAAGQQGRPPRQPRVGRQLAPVALEGGQHAQPIDGEVAGMVGSWASEDWEGSPFHPGRRLGPAGSQPLGRHLRAYDGLPARMAERARAAFGDAVAPVIPELIARALIAWEEQGRDAA